MFSWEHNFTSWKRAQDLMLLCFWPPVRDLCPNYEVVIFQPRTVTPPHIGSRLLFLHSNLALPYHLFLLLPLDFSFPPLFYRLPIHSRSFLKLSRITRSPPPLMVQSAAHLGAARTCHPPPASTRRLSLQPALCACIWLRFPFGWALPFATLGLHPGPNQPLGGSPVSITSTPLCPCLALPKFSSESWHLPVLGIVVGWIFVKRREARAPPLPGSCVPW